MKKYTDLTDGKQRTVAELAALTRRDEAQHHAAKMGITHDELMALRRHPDKAWARAEAKRLMARR